MPVEHSILITMENRLRLVRKELKLTQEALAQRLGIGKSALSMIETGKAALSRRNINILSQEFNVRVEWLETGQGEMFEQALPLHCSSEIKLVGREGIPMQEVPLYNTDLTGGLSPIFSKDSDLEPLGCICIPNITKCDGAVYVNGEGMYPLLKSGDIVLYKQLNDTNDIFWGDMYLLSVSIGEEEYIMVKYIHKSDKPGCVRLVSESRSHEDKDVEISKIRALAFVRASIRMNRIG